MRSVGLDLGTRKIALCEVEGGKVIRRATVESVKELEPLLGPGSGPARVAFEASRSAWAVHAELCGWGHDVKMIDTTRVKQIGIGQHGKKNDAIDAECLAMAVEKGQVPEAHVLSVRRQRLRHLMMSRRALVETRTTMVTTIRGIATSEGVRLARCEPENFVAMLKRQELPATLTAMVMPLAEVVATVERQLCELDARVYEACADERAAQCMMTVPGVGAVVAGMFLSVIDDAKRFRSARQVTSYLGLVPRENSSGTTGQRLGSITKQGNRYLRALLIQAAWHMVRQKNTDNPLAFWGLSVAARRGRKIAVVAVARRLAAILWALWRRGVAYDPAHIAQLCAAGLDLSAEVQASQAEGFRRVEAKVKLGTSVLKRRTKNADAIRSTTMSTA
jgi:transposase